MKIRISEITVSSPINGPTVIVVESVLGGMHEQKLGLSGSQKERQHCQEEDLKQGNYGDHIGPPERASATAELV